MLGKCYQIEKNIEQGGSKMNSNLESVIKQIDDLLTQKDASS